MTLKVVSAVSGNTHPLFCVRSTFAANVPGCLWHLYLRHLVTVSLMHMRPIGTAPASISGKADRLRYARPQTCSVTHRSLTCVHLFSIWRSNSSVCYNQGRLRSAPDWRPQQESEVIKGVYGMDGQSSSLF